MRTNTPAGVVYLSSCPPTLLRTFSATGNYTVELNDTRLEDVAGKLDLSGYGKDREESWKVRRSVALSSFARGCVFLRRKSLSMWKFCFVAGVLCLGVLCLNFV